MKIEKRDSSDERKILISLIVDPIVISRIAAKWQKGMFRIKYANLITNWCIKYFEDYGAAPGKDIVNLFHSWADKTKDTESIELVEAFLETISDEYEKEEHPNSEYIIDLAGKHFNKVQLERMQETLEGDLASGDIDKAIERIQGYNKVELGLGSWVDPFAPEIIQSAFEASSEPIIRYSGALGHFFGNDLARDSFVCFMAPDKTGKSYWLMDVAWRGLLHQRKVAIFQIGDMSQDQYVKRIAIRAAGLPKEPCSIEYPKGIKRNGEEIEIETITKKYDKPLSWQRAYSRGKLFCEHKLRKKNLIRLSVHPNDSITVNGICNTISTWEREGWVPDMIVIDYADLLTSDHPNLDKRDQIDQTWKNLRKLSQITHSLVVTATQTNAGAYKKDIIGRENFSEDKRKLAHVTAMYGINMTETDKEQGIQRLNVVVRREDAFNENHCVIVAGCMDLGRPAILSCF